MDDGLAPHFQATRAFQFSYLPMIIVTFQIVTPSTPLAPPPKTAPCTQTGKTSTTKRHQTSSSNAIYADRHPYTHTQTHQRAWRRHCRQDERQQSGSPQRRQYKRQQGPNANSDGHRLEGAGQRHAKDDGELERAPDSTNCFWNWEHGNSLPGGSRTYV